jgi:hypothetical protein
MTVRTTIEQLLSEPAVADLGYPADQRLVATVVLGLKLLADSIDDIEARFAETTRPPEVATASAVPAEMHDISAKVHDITEQVGKLAKSSKRPARRSRNSSPTAGSVEANQRPTDHDSL